MKSIILLFANLILLTLFVLWIWRAARFAVKGRNEAPFVPIPKKSLSGIVDAIDPKKGEIIFDLGSGDGRVLFALFEKCKDAEYIGVDKDIIPFFISKIVLFFKGSPKNILFKKENFFKTDLRKKDKIFIYLFPKVMDALLPKFEAELKKGTKVVSCDFYFSKKQPVYSGEIRSGSGLGRKIFVYEF